ncbi:MAG TPA: hypothetical protein IAD09_06305 [Candidatus Caccoplasma merdavium]|nr:hypothetical protein [Candidatus Caccoplasma merdavium]
MGKYDVNFRRLALLLLPTFWRRPLFGAFAFALVTPVSHLHVRFMQYRQRTGYRLRHNGQVCYLRAVLNDEFDPELRRITISDSDKTDFGTVVYRRVARRPLKLPLRADSAGVKIYRRGFTGAGAVDFIVGIPAALRGNIDESRLSGVVDTYRLASMRYAVLYGN